MPNTYTDRAVESLIINKMTQAQYDALPEKSDTELYLIDGGESSMFAEQMIVMPAASEAYANRIVQFVGNSTMTYTTGYFYRCVLQGGSYVWKKINVQPNQGGGGGSGQEIQFEDLPEATSENVGQIIQYIGEHIPKIPVSATVTQIIGNSLSDLEIDVNKFVGTEQPILDEVLNFTCTSSNAPRIETRDSGRGFELEILDVQAIIDEFDRAGYGYAIDEGITYGGFNWYTDNTWKIFIEASRGQHYINPPEGCFRVLVEPDPLPEESVVALDITGLYRGAYTWEDDNQVEVNTEDYGISYSGVPSVNDKLRINYYAYRNEYNKGYFYINDPIYSKEKATISQTVGSGLTNLVVDLDTFVAQEQPTQDETLTFVSRGLEAPFTLMVGNNITATANNPKQIDTVFKQKTGNPAPKSGQLFYNNINQWYFRDDNGYGLVDTQWDPETGRIDEFDITIGGDIANVQIGDYFTFTYDETWTKDNVQVDVSDYGISYSGISKNNDELVVVYTAPEVVSYEWNQINVQPANQQNDSIEWVKTLDLPKDYTGSTWSTTGIVKIVGGLPDGEYEFYYYTSCYPDNSSSPVRYVTERVIFKLDNTNNTAYGSFGPVLSEWMPSGNYRINDASFWNPFRKDGNDFIFFVPSRPFATDIPGYPDNIAEDIKDCFKVSCIKNMKTGEKFVPEFILYDGTNNPGGNEITGGIEQKNIVNEPPREYTHTTNSFYISGTENNYLYCNVYGAVSNKNIQGSCSELDFSLSTDSGGKYHIVVENGTYSYVARVLEASGNLANAEAITLDNGYFGIKPNINEGCNLYCAAGVKGAQYQYIDCWMVETPETYDVLTISSVGYPINVDNYGVIDQYTGETNNNYINGYFYKATGTKVVAPASVTCETTNPTYTVELDDVDSFIEGFMAYSGHSRRTTENWLNDRFNFIYYNNENRFWWQCYGDIPTSLLEYFTITPELAPGNDLVWMTYNYNPSHIDIQNPHWEQVNVQPASGGDDPNVIPPIVEANYSWGIDRGEASWIVVKTAREQPEVGDYLYHGTSGKPIQGITTVDGELFVPYPGWLRVESYDPNEDAITISANGVIVRDIYSLNPMKIYRAQ